MSHVGNWEVAARTLKREGYDMMLFMGRKEREQAEGVQKADLKSDGLAVVAKSEKEDSPFEILDALRFLKKGGFVSMAGDRALRAGHSVTVTFFGRSVQLPATPYLLAAIARVPVFIFFCFRTGRRSFLVEYSAPVHFEHGSRQERNEAIVQAAQAYATELERMVRRYPCQWHHFEPFLDGQSV